MIVFDASTLVSAAFRRGSVPARAFLHALRSDRVMAELRDALARPRLVRFVDPELRDEVLASLDLSAVLFAPTERVETCRDAKDNKYLELALASGAWAIVSGDADLLAWSSVRIVRPAEYLAEVGAEG